MPTASEQAHSAALLGAFGSQQVQALYEAWQAIALHAKQMYELVLRSEAINDHGDHAVEAQRRLNVELKPAEVVARAALEDQVALELGSRSARRGPRPSTGDAATGDSKPPA